MDERTKLIILYDYYGNLLNDNQKKIFEDYYFDNLSLSEIAENNSVSRNAIHKQTKLIEEKLLWYESILHLMTKNDKILKLVRMISDMELQQKFEKLLREDEFNE